MEEVGRRDVPCLHLTNPARAAEHCGSAADRAAVLRLCGEARKPDENLTRGKRTKESREAHVYQRKGTRRNTAKIKLLQPQTLRNPGC